jgi:hypothetical protein
LGSLSTVEPVTRPDLVPEAVWNPAKSRMCCWDLAGSDEILPTKNEPGNVCGVIQITQLFMCGIFVPETTGLKNAADN